MKSSKGLTLLSSSPRTSLSPFATLLAIYEREVVVPPEIFYDDVEARKYTSFSHIVQIQVSLSKRALELLALPDDHVPKLLLDISCGSRLSGKTLSENGHHWIEIGISASMLNVAMEREVEVDLLLGDMGRGLGIRPRVIDGAISISAVQWLCNADNSSHNPRLRLKAFFTSLYKCLSNGARAVFQVYPENIDQCELILNASMHVGFVGSIVVDFPHSSKRRKEFLVLTCGQHSINVSISKGKNEDGDSYSDKDNEDEENQTITTDIPDFGNAGYGQVM
ncbi:18S rRNA (guanine-N(7))-methyltransferase RID2-like [Glycine soja]|uniref:18S rRNA (guanine-N(7))-methyltransferase RID2-like n=1 Tax=Glycine soja TaxID=3848 RepID=UPI0010393532|nr:18S rRNA (guanine-N(7))-methyltransferase RID2-like [Glycine soja]